VQEREVKTTSHTLDPVTLLTFHLHDQEKHGAAAQVYTAVAVKEQKLFKV
jgi:hypothetical protein